MRAGAYGLRKHGVLLLFPEGERSIDGPPKTFKKGAAILAVNTQCPVVPVAIEGFHEAWPRGEKFRGFSKLKVRFLDPVYPPPLGPNPEQQYAQMTAEIRARVIEAYEELQHPKELAGLVAERRRAVSRGRHPADRLPLKQRSRVVRSNL